MNKSLAVALIVTILDAMGVGLVMPVLPALLREHVQPGEVAAHYGALLSLYALMQVCFAPLLGRLSDRYGRRPVLLVSLAGSAIDYAIMAAAPELWVLYIGRLVSGITGATGSVAAAAIADTTKESERARWFGYMSACFGVGIIAGPAIGGMLGEQVAHAPFIAAALLNGAACVFACFALAETGRNASDGERPGCPGPLAGLRQRGVLRSVAPLFYVFFLVQLIGQVPGALWVIYGEDRFQWDTAMVGLSLAAFGAMHALVQAFLTGRLSSRLGERLTLLVGMASDAAGFLLLAFVTQGWMVWPILALLASGGVGMPALQSMLSRAAGNDQQGRLQGLLASLTNLTSVVGPLGFTMLYAATSGIWNGCVWIVGAMLYLACLPALRRSAMIRAPGLTGMPAWRGHQRRPA
ncbi:Tetracycline resistance protein, class G [Bosea sp. 62]|uniref:Tet(A)/Tet(B)/Tet(C) family tetracycline efflux MFS transporter n=1 Tax=unclassified Bosea (in: a-proteobacteria) TaxID=2653178 RepID=UPI00125192F3|nr:MULTISPECIES: Tet(A)/Tet(B)/Tet(C) family tetracycline efflux MFS transporter [unclassified Bosea (in: a-proteobacteria)]CAD5255521.1 Tetracycline resistance protein, class G [Bosea sp. 7B]CAD5275272.1 Tetracycline resistance protein, class G [Bosea sp. 21B]CAD5276395.1 Tetracycline resistance protein, class G [Bosea sp. 46]VVT60010.1 Tetracycline resistance protein, class G [Bosea sp. EC-HK365B]VXB51533.1 Tetracycline resistance protein, class G [Bosea sp. 62]